MAVQANISFAAMDLFNLKPIDKQRVWRFEQMLEHGDPAAHHEFATALERAGQGFDATAIIGGKFRGFGIEFFQQQICQRRHRLFQIGERRCKIGQGIGETFDKRQTIGFQ